MSRITNKTSHRTSSPVFIRPVAVSEKSALENVVNFFADVVPQSASYSDDREGILWVKFEQLSQPIIGDRQDDKKDGILTALLIIGYANGVQIWQMHPSGDAQEVVSLRQGPIKIFSIVQRYKESSTLPLQSEHLIASAEEAKHSSAPFSCLKLTALLTGETIWNHSFKATINEVYSNTKLLLLSFHLKISAFDVSSLKPVFNLSGCFPTDGPNLNPVALGSSWLAYADSKLIGHVKSHGEADTGAAHSYTAAVLSTAKNVAMGVSTLGESLMNSFSGSQRHRRESGGVPLQHSGTPGVVTVIDCDKLYDSAGPTPRSFELTENYCGEEVVCHFQALAHPVAQLRFDHGGTLLFCACREGQSFHIYRILADMCGARHASIQHLYVLHRGDTTAQVLDVTFSIDSRWVGVCTARGTTHVFPINPYGGKCTARTHTSLYVVNKSTKYQKSAGLEEFTQSLANRVSSQTFIDSLHSSDLRFNCGALENPRLQHYSDTHFCHPITQIKQPMRLNPHPTHRHIPTKSIAAFFTTTLGRARKLSLDVRAPQARESLYVMTNMGDLVEYILDPCCDCDYDKIGDDTELRLSVTARSRWPLNRTHSKKDRTSFTYNHLLGSSPGSDKGGARYGSKESISSDTGSSKSNEFDQPWLSQVEIVTYSGPNRRLWMGPQFKFKTYNNNSFVVSSQSPALFPSATPEVHATSDIICDTTDLESLQINNQPTPPITMPSNCIKRQVSMEGLRQRASCNSMDGNGTYIEAGSFEPPPHFVEQFCDAFEDADATTYTLLADAMQERRTSSESLSSKDLMDFPPEEM